LRITSDLANPTGHEINALGNYHISHYTVTRQACAATWSRKKKKKKKDCRNMRKEAVKLEWIIVYYCHLFSPHPLQYLLPFAIIIYSPENVWCNKL